MHPPYQVGLRKCQHHGGKTQFLSSGSNRSIASHVSIHRLLNIELGGFWIEVHSDPGIIGSSFPLSSTTDFPLLVTLVIADFSSSFIVTEIRKNGWEQEDQKRARKKKMQRFEKIPKPQMVAFLKLRKMSHPLIRDLHILRQIRLEPSLQICGIHLEHRILQKQRWPDRYCWGCDTYLRLFQPIERCTPLRDET